MAEPLAILVTGDQGQVSRALQKLAQDDPAVSVHATSRAELDLANPESIDTAIRRRKPALIISAAAYTAVDKAESEPALAHAVNADGAGALANAAAAIGAPILHISTDYVFGNDSDAPHRESDPTDPQSVYGASKLAGEQLVAAHNPQHIITRTAWVYDAEGANFVRTMLRLAETRDELSVVADQTGNPTAADDLAAALLRIARQYDAEPERFAPLWGTYHLAGTGAVNWADFARYIFQVSAACGGPSAIVHDIGTQDYPTPAPRPRNSVLDCSAATRAFGIEMPHWKDSLRRTIETLYKSR